MVPVPLNLGQRILDAARIAQAIHRDLDRNAAPNSTTPAQTAGGAGRISFDQHDHDDNSN